MYQLTTKYIHSSEEVDLVLYTDDLTVLFKDMFRDKNDKDRQ